MPENYDYRIVSNPNKTDEYIVEQYVEGTWRFFAEAVSANDANAVIDEARSRIRES